MSDNNAVVKQPFFSAVTYDTIKDLVQIGFPGAVTLYAGLAAIWVWPNTEQVVGSAGAVIVFLGILLKISAKRFQALPDPEPVYDGVLVVNETDPEKDLVSLQLEKNYTELSDADVVTVKVVNPLRNSQE